MSSDVVIRTRDLGKQYRLGTAAALNASLRDRFDDALRALRTGRSPRRHVPASSQAPTVWAVRHLDLEVRQGEVLGIVGSNGAGKSTLLKILARITHPTEGRAELHGRVGSLLEVGTGFHPELTGRENVLLNGAILGMSGAEIRRKFDAIVDFAEVETFIDTPVKHYSSGMYVRLAFAVAAHLETEILIVDEVLAVGDLRFQKKCLGQIDSIARGGRTVMFVSHNMEAVQRLCSRGLWIEQGRLAAEGAIQDVIRRYRETGPGDGALGVFRQTHRRHVGWARFLDVRLMKQNRRVSSIAPEDDLVVEIDVAVSNEASGADTLRGLVVELSVVTEHGQPLLSVMNVDHDALELPASRACTVQVRLAGPTFVPGRYRLGLFLGWPYLAHVDDVPDALEFEVTPPERPWRPYPLHPMRGAVCRRAEWSAVPAGVQSAVGAE